MCTCTRWPRAPGARRCRQAFESCRLSAASAASSAAGRHPPDSCQWQTGQTSRRPARRIACMLRNGRVLAACITTCLGAGPAGHPGSARGPITATQPQKAKSPAGEGWAKCLPSNEFLAPRPGLEPGTYGLTARNQYHPATVLHHFAQVQQGVYRWTDAHQAGAADLAVDHHRGGARPGAAAAYGAARSPLGAASSGGTRPAPLTLPLTTTVVVLDQLRLRPAARCAGRSTRPARRHRARRSARTSGRSERPAPARLPPSRAERRSACARWWPAECPRSTAGRPRRRPLPHRWGQVGWRPRSGPRRPAVRRGARRRQHPGPPALRRPPPPPRAGPAMLLAVHPAADRPAPGGRPAVGAAARPAVPEGRNAGALRVGGPLRYFSA